MIRLVPVPPKLATSYGKAGRTRDDANQPYKYEKLVKAEMMARSNPDGWSCTPGMARALELLDADMRERGSAGLRLTEVRRSWAFQAAERAKFDNWVRAGRPEQGSRAYQAPVMRTTFVAQPGESNHQWGAAVDFDVYALDFPDTPDDSQLSTLWELALERGFTPIIAHPERSQSECWHFDHFGPLKEVYRLFAEAGRKNAAYRSAYALTAFTGCVLTGTFQGQGKMERLLQARLLLAGQFVGKPDGQIGKMTMAGLEAVGVTGVTRATPASILLGRLDELGVGAEALAEA